MGLNRHSRYSLTFERDFSSDGREITGKSYCANIINTSWIFSRYWDKKDDEDSYGWIPRATIDVKSRIAILSDELKQLKQVENILNNVRENHLP